MIEKHLTNHTQSPTYQDFTKQIPSILQSKRKIQKPLNKPIRVASLFDQNVENLDLICQVR